MLASIVAILVVVVNWAISAGTIKQRLTAIEGRLDYVMGEMKADIAEVKKTAEKAHFRIDEHITGHLKGEYKDAKRG